MEYDVRQKAMELLEDAHVHAGLKGNLETNIEEDVLIYMEHLVTNAKLNKNIAKNMFDYFKKYISVKQSNTQKENYEKRKRGIFEES